MLMKLTFFLLVLTIITTPVLCDLVISKVDRRIDLTSHTARITSNLKVENVGSTSVSEVFLAFPEIQAKNLAYLAASETKGKEKNVGASLPVKVAEPKGMPSSLIFYSIELPKPLIEGEVFSFDVLAVFSHALQPFPENIAQHEFQLVVFQNSAYFLSPYEVTVQSLTVKLPGTRIESFTKLEKTKQSSSEIKYGPYESLPPFSYSPITFHFENNHPFVVAEELVREIEISHWGNVQITEHYSVVHDGAKSKGEFSRLDYQARPDVRGAYAFRHLLASLPPRAHSIYYRDEIGNISTSNVWSDLKKTEVLIEPRYPIFGGWKTAFTIGYGLPLQDFLFESKGKRFLNITFGSSIKEIVIDNLIVKVVLPEGSSDFLLPLHFRLYRDKRYYRPITKISHLDIDGRPVVVLEKTNVVPEHNQYFQVYYKFNILSMLREPLMLIFGFFCFFVACIVYVHVDLSISKSSASYLEKLQWDEVRATIQQLQSIINQCLAVHDKLEASLRDLSRTGDVHACKLTRKTADGLLKEHSKELKPLLSYLHSSPQAAQILTKVEELVAMERELQDRLMAKHSTIVDCYDKKLGGREIENRVAALQQKVLALRQEVEDLLDYIDEI